MIYNLQDKSFEEIMLDSEHSYWKKIVVNFFLSLMLTLKMAGYATTLTFLNYFAGVGVFTFFAASLNIDDQSLSNFSTCNE